MKKQYIFLIMIGIILYISYLIISFTYEEYKINSYIEILSELNNDIREGNKKANEIIEYKKSKAYRNKVLKEQQSYKNKAEHVVYLTSEDTYNKFSGEYVPFTEEVKMSPVEEHEGFIDSMSIYEKWVYFFFKKDIR